MNQHLLLPFEMQDPNTGFTRVSGIVGLRDNRLIIEFQKTDNLFRAFKWPLVEREIPLSEVILVDASSNVFRSFLLLRVARLTLADGLYAKGNEIKLRIKRSDRPLAFDLVDAIRSAQAQHRPG